MGDFEKIKLLGICFFSGGSGGSGGFLGFGGYHCACLLVH